MTISFSLTNWAVAWRLFRGPRPKRRLDRWIWMLKTKGEMERSPHTARYRLNLKVRVVLLQCKVLVKLWIVGSLIQ